MHTLSRDPDALEPPAPEVAPQGPRRCARCGQTGYLLVYVPTSRGAGVRLCQSCLALFDRARTAPPASDA